MGWHFTFSLGVPPRLTARGRAPAGSTVPELVEGRSASPYGSAPSVPLTRTFRSLNIPLPLPERSRRVRKAPEHARVASTPLSQRGMQGHGMPCPYETDASAGHVGRPLGVGAKHISPLHGFSSIFLYQSGIFRGRVCGRGAASLHPYNRFCRIRPRNKAPPNTPLPLPERSRRVRKAPEHARVASTSLSRRGM